MENYLEKLRDYVKENPVTFEVEDPRPCLDALWWHYCEFHGLDTDLTKAGYSALNAQLAALPFADRESILQEVGRLCMEYERSAFAAGVRLGAQLMLELQE